MNKYICLHGHFYQPPRENPWLEEIEGQDSARPFHDWNERISFECYSRNSASRILNNDKKIIDIVNNYSKISFNFGPTLLSWMEKKDPETYRDLLYADQLSQQNFSGHGSALAQVYNHMIMPLANERDKRTQISWGIKDFEYRFKRKPEGMWLAETAVDIVTLEILAEYGILFTILAPHQAKSVKKILDKKWISVEGQKIDPKKPYLCRLPSGKNIVIFFYDGPIAQGVAFEGLLNDGEEFSRRLLRAFDIKTEENQIVHIATDGETYGHHHKFADMALAYCLRTIEKNNLAKITIYGEFLEKFPPQEEVEIHENTSWSCAHGIERWRSDCGCCIGTNPKWNQKWREGLRFSLDWLRDEGIKVYEKEMGLFVEDVWALRNQYISVILNRDKKAVESFFAKNIQRSLSENDKVKILKLLEMQRNAQLMYTSCGWFFDEISGIEPTQVLKYAARVIQLIKEVSGIKIEESFLGLLEKIKSNVKEIGDARNIYLQQVQPFVVDLFRVGAHYAVSSLFEKYPKETKIYCYTIRTERSYQKEDERLKLSMGCGTVQSDITLEQTPIFFAGFHLGNHNIIRGVKELLEGDYSQAQKEIVEAFITKQIPEANRLIDKYYGPENYSLEHLFKEEQQKILDEVLKTTMDEIEESFREIYEKHHPLMQVQKELQVTLPKALATIAEFVLNRDLCDVIQSDPIDLKRLRMLVWEIMRWSFSRDKQTICFIAGRKVNELMKELIKNPDDINLIETLISVVESLSILNYKLDLWKAQNIYFILNRKLLKDKKGQAEKRDPRSQRWVEAFELLGEFLQVETV
ncbi:MAG: DUF3536 domain-containing protein [Candidatus Omnitrophica bacterium]|nr:DUF3536 domain-containing protein [Candidatus Omnitrophota bacterium]